MPKQPGLFSIGLTYSIECGSDTVLLLYRRDAAGYHRILLWQNPDLNSTGDAFGDIFAWAFVPAPVPAVAVVHGTPWCTSNMSMFHVDLVAVAAGNKPQHLLDHLDHDYRRDDVTTLRPEPEGFELHTEVDSISGDLVFAPAVLRYNTTTGHLVQEPVAPNARSFVDQWINSEWPVVESWGDPASQPRLQALHDRFANRQSASMEFGPVLACEPRHFQVELDHEQYTEGPNPRPVQLPSQYAQVRANANSFTLLDVTAQPDPACKGPDLMKGR